MLMALTWSCLEECPPSSFLFALCPTVGSHPSEDSLGSIENYSQTTDVSWDRPRLDKWLRPFPLSTHGGYIHLGMRRGS